MSKHTETPWYVQGHEIKVNKPEREHLGDGAPETICEMNSSVSPEETTANAEFIVQACNAHDDLLAALRAVVFQACQGKVLERDACIAQARTAIAKEERKENDLD
jgi:hypothetical protein